MSNGLLEVIVMYVIHGPIIILANVNIEANRICTIFINITLKNSFIYKTDESDIY